MKPWKFGHGPRPDTLVLGEEWNIDTEHRNDPNFCIVIKTENGYALRRDGQDIIEVEAPTLKELAAKMWKKYPQAARDEDV